MSVHAFPSYRCVASFVRGQELTRTSAGRPGARVFAESLGKSIGREDGATPTMQTALVLLQIAFRRSGAPKAPGSIFLSESRYRHVG
jgi:hypothetical protein